MPTVDPGLVPVVLSAAGLALAVAMIVLKLLEWRGVVRWGGKGRRPMGIGAPGTAWGVGTRTDCWSGLHSGGGNAGCGSSGGLDGGLD